MMTNCPGGIVGVRFVPLVADLTTIVCGCVPVFFTAKETGPARVCLWDNRT